MSGRVAAAPARPDPAKRGSLVVVGTGIKLAAQTTLEALACMQRAEMLLCVVADPATECWLRRLTGSVTSLMDCYAEGKPRQVTYKQMAARIMGAVRAQLEVCAAFYGHPGVFVDPAHLAIRQARREGFQARMLPGISAEDCLFADLGIDPSKHGCQSFEATDFLALHRRFDPSSALILWQAGVLGEPSIRYDRPCRAERLQVLTTALRRYYPARHPVVLYEAAQFPGCRPLIKRIPLARMPEVPVYTMTTLYLRPKRSRLSDRKIMNWFDEA
jgi:Tetrapyrrole (Corrin/Porphyrin) Methylases